MHVQLQVWTKSVLVTPTTHIPRTLNFLFRRWWAQGNCDILKISLWCSSLPKTRMTIRTSEDEINAGSPRGSIDNLVAAYMYASFNWGRVQLVYTQTASFVARVNACRRRNYSVTLQDHVHISVSFLWRRIPKGKIIDFADVVPSYRPGRYY